MGGKPKSQFRAYSKFLSIDWIRIRVGKRMRLDPEPNYFQTLDESEDNLCQGGYSSTVLWTECHTRGERRAVCCRQSHCCWLWATSAPWTFTICLYKERWIVKKTFSLFFFSPDTNYTSPLKFSWHHSLYQNKLED